MDKEDGEMSDDNMMLVDNAKDPSEVQRECTVIYKAEKNCILVEELEKVDASKLEERAKRFGLNLTGTRVITQTQIDQLYANFGIESGNERHFRFDTLHLRGVDGLTTKEVFEYLEDYKPVSLEWIDDHSCNIVCQDHISVALALLVHSREINNDNLKEMIFDKSSHWREGMPHPKKDLILMRFATNGDKKMAKRKSEFKRTDDFYDQNLDSVSKNPWGDLCQSWGVYDHQEILQHRLTYNEDKEELDTVHKEVKIQNRRMAMRLGKRNAQHVKHYTDESEDSSSDSEWKKKSKVPRMRMHADDEESKQKIKQIEMPKDKETLKGDTFAPLCIEVTNSRGQYTPRESTKLSDKFKYHNSQKQSIHSRLGEKLTPMAEVWSSENSSNDSDCNVMSKVQKVDNRTTKSVWSRLETKPDKSNVQSDLRKIITSKNHKDKPDDLRDRLGKSKQANLRIEIDNNYLSKS